MECLIKIDDVLLYTKTAKKTDTHPEDNDYAVPSLAPVNRSAFLAHVESQIDGSSMSDDDAGKFMDKINQFMDMQEDNKILTDRNRGVIVEVHNYAQFLRAANDMIGNEGPASFDFEIREEVASARPSNMFDMIMTSNLSRRILGVPIGRWGAAVTLNDILEMLNSILLVKIKEDGKHIEYSINLLLAVNGC